MEARSPLISRLDLQRDSLGSPKKAVFGSPKKWINVFDNVGAQPTFLTGTL
jgi:hypothetical protein